MAFTYKMTVVVPCVGTLFQFTVLIAYQLDIQGVRNLATPTGMAFSFGLILMLEVSTQHTKDKPPGTAIFAWG